MTLDDLAALAEQATPGPWTVQDNGEWLEEGDERVSTYKVIGPDYVEVEDGYYIRAGDATYIAACSPEVIKALVAVAKAAERMDGNLVLGGREYVLARSDIRAALDALRAVMS
jgi:hypothetical protein